MEAYISSGQPVETMNHISPADLTPDMLIYDCRNPTEFQNGHVENATLVPLIEV